MTKVRWDVTESDAEEAAKVRSFDSPKPGMYLLVITECEASGSGGDPDKPMLRVVLEIEDADKKSNEQFIGGNMWYYPLLPGHPSYDGFPMQKTDQFLQAAGVATKRKRKGSLDTDDVVGVELVGQVRAGKNQDGDYRGEIANVLAYDEDEWAARKDETTSDDDDDEEAYDEPDMPDDEDEEGEDEETEDDEDEEVTDYTKWSVADLKAELEERELDIPKGKAKMVTALEDDDEGDEGDEDEEPDEEDEEDEDEQDYASMSIGDLRALAKERDLNPRGTKPTLIERLEEDDEGAEDEEEEEEEPAPRKRKAAVKKPAARKKATAKKPAVKRKSAARGRGKGKSSDGFPFEP